MYVEDFSARTPEISSIFSLNHYPRNHRKIRNNFLLDTKAIGIVWFSKWFRLMVCSSYGWRRLWVIIYVGEVGQLCPLLASVIYLCIVVVTFGIEVNADFVVSTIIAEKLAIYCKVWPRFKYCTTVLYLWYMASQYLTFQLRPYFFNEVVLQLISVPW